MSEPAANGDTVSEPVPAEPCSAGSAGSAGSVGPGASAGLAASAGPGASAGPAARPWRVAFSMFSVLPVAGPGAIGREVAARAIGWLPVVGAVLGAAAALLLAAVDAIGSQPPASGRRLLAAALGVAVLAALTGGLHLDGLADTADGLGSRRTGAEALAIMRRPEIGALGAAALLLTVLLQVSALAAIGRWPAAACALLLAAVTGRVAVVLATGPRFAPARPGGFGALVAGAASGRLRWLTAAALVTLAAGAGALAGGWRQEPRFAAGALAGLAAGEILSRVARRRLGGMTGDVFGALVETGAAVTLIVIAAWP